ncbi:MAG TPA: hypothetical protein VFQ13_14375 [Anaerolineales bacterium]|nr:hypothetical protein [Anaerolineales bacterium]
MNPNPAKPKPERERNERQDWLIVLLILLIGLCCVAGAGQYALRFVPKWQLDADMGSNIDLNSEFLTSKPIAYFEPVDPAILTQPAWVNGNVFLTPGAGSSFVSNRTPLPTSNSSSGVPTVIGTTAVATNPGVVTNTVVPTNTLVWIPIPATRTSRPNPGATATNTSPPPGPPRADLQITMIDGTGIYVSGGTLTYTIVVSNTGPSSVTGATVTDNFSVQISGATGSCAVAGGAVCGWSGSGNINDTVNLPVGSSITYTVTVTINPGATGSLVNTASVGIPAGYTESNSANNSVTDTNTFSGNANLQITKSDGTGTYVPGGTLTYTIVVSNTGPSSVTGATVTDTFPGQITGASWTCAITPGASCTASGSGNINDSAVNLPVGRSVTYTVHVNIGAGASGNLSNTASVSLPAGYTGPSPVSATDTDTASPTANLQITKSDGTGTYIPGGTLTYTIVVSNSGPSNVTGATVIDNFPVQISGFGAGGGCAVTGGATCTWGGSGNINDTVNLPVGSSITYTVPVNISAGASGNLSNTASVSLPAGYTGTSPVSATDTDTASPAANLTITKSDGVAIYVPGGTLTYSIVVSNSGPSNVIGAIVTDNFPAQISGFGAGGGCAAAGGATCTWGGSGNINDTVNLPVGSSITYTVPVNISAGASGSLVNTASVNLPAGYAGTSPVSATDTDAPSGPLTANLWITKTDNATDYVAGGSTTYYVTVGNSGPSPVNGVIVSDTLPGQISAATWTCAGTPGASCTASGSGNINDSAVNLPVGSSVTYTIVASINGGVSGNLVNTAYASLPVGYAGTSPVQATDTDTQVIVNSPGNIGSSPDCPGANCTEELAAGSTRILNTSITVPGVGGPDLIYYERPNGGNIRMDWVVLQIGDGHNWYTILDWGNQYGGGADINTNINVNVIGGIEDDDRVISQNNLYPYPGTGVEIELDGFVPPGTYTYIRIIVPWNDPSGNGCGIDAIEVLSP